MREYQAFVVTNKRLTNTVYEMVLRVERPLPLISSGQFAMVEVSAGILRRPFCVVSSDKYTFRIVYAVVGKGTREMSTWTPEHPARVTVPLGNGFTLDPGDKTIVLLGGGLGILPLLNIINEYNDRAVHAFFGFANAANVILAEEIERATTSHICTDDGSLGFHGYPTDCLRAHLEQIQPDVILSCGSHPFLRAVKALALQSGIKTLFSGEARMACGVGACLVCTCATEGKTQEFRRMCTDGPVFDIREVVL